MAKSQIALKSLVEQSSCLYCVPSNKSSLFLLINFHENFLFIFVRAEHHVIAGADFLVVPSRFEPGGFIQLLGMQHSAQYAYFKFCYFFFLFVDLSLAFFFPFYNNHAFRYQRSHSFLLLLNKRSVLNSSLPDIICKMLF